MLLANKHFTPVVGLDIHIVTLPPGVPTPLPHPFIGLVMDVMDYVPFIGSKVNINFVPRGIADTSGMLAIKAHIPMGGPFLMAPLIAHDSVNFFGSLKVKAEDVALSPAGYMVMSCNDIGMPLSLSPGKKMIPMPSMYLPTSQTIPLPLGKPVMVGGPYAPDLLGILKQLVMSYGFGALMKGLGAAAKKAARKVKDDTGKVRILLKNAGKESGNSLNKPFFDVGGIKLSQYVPDKIRTGQSEGHTCVATSLKMLLGDKGINVSESQAAEALGTNEFGARVIDIPSAMEKLGFENKVERISSYDQLEKSLNQGNSAIVSVSAPGKGAHAIVVDGIKDGQVLIRDPLPVGTGHSYGVSIADFKSLFNNKAVIIN